MDFIGMAQMLTLLYKRRQRLANSREWPNWRPTANSVPRATARRPNATPNRAEQVSGVET